MALIPSASLAYAATTTDVLPEWVVDDSQPKAATELTVQEEEATSLTLDSTKISPVKLQSPWDSIGTFGGTAALETAILTSTDTTSVNLSEKQLTYFGLRPVTSSDSSTQAGEGLYLKDDTQSNAAFNEGMLRTYLTTLFSQGLGFASESEQDSTDAYPYAYWGKNATFASSCYSSSDDWSIADTDEDGKSNRLHTNGYLLGDGNILPEYWADDAKTDNEAGVAAIKGELKLNRAVSIRFYEDSAYLNTSNWAEYCNVAGNEANQTALIVGYDDNYATTNFTSGNQPTGNGAWIVKGSWGSETDAETDANGNYANWSEWGYTDSNGKHTGYFYLSYEDATICAPESVSVLSTYADNETLATQQYDFMPASDFYTTTPTVNSVTSSANVFTADTAQKLVSVSTRTAEDDMHVVFAIYQLNDSYESPADGTLRYRFSADFDYSGFHRVELSSPVTFNAGDKYAIIATTYALVSDDSTDKRYSASAAQGVSESYADTLSLSTYAKAVVNAGESYLYTNGAWIDWSSHLAALTITEDDTTIAYADRYQVDNFAIKADTVELVNDLDYVAAVAPTCTTAGNVEYYHDRVTDKYYLYQNGAYVLTDSSSITLAALGHSWGEGVVTLQPTSTKAGVRTYTCTRCGATKTEYISPTKATASSTSSTATRAVKPELDGSSDLPATGDASPLHGAWIASALALVACGFSLRRGAARA